DRRSAPMEAPHLDAADREHHDQRAPRELGPEVPDEPRLVDREEADQERCRDREAEEIQKAKDAPAEIRIGGEQLFAELRGFRGSFGGGHGCAHLNRTPRFSSVNPAAAKPFCDAFRPGPSHPRGRQPERTVLPLRIRGLSWTIAVPHARRVLRPRSRKTSKDAIS